MSFEISGTLIEKYNTTAISDRFKKREFVLEKRENSNGFEFTDFIKFQLTQDKCSLLDNYQTGDELKVSFNLRGRKWEKDGKVNYFTNLEAWKIEQPQKENQSSPGQSSDNEPPMPGTDDFSGSPDEDINNLPF